MKIWKICVITIAMFTILATNTGCVMAKEIKLSTSEVKEKTISNFTVPIPVLGDFKVYMKLRTETHGDLNVDLCVDKQMISPNEDLEITS